VGGRHKKKENSENMEKRPVSRGPHKIEQNKEIFDSMLPAPGGEAWRIPGGPNFNEAPVGFTSPKGGPNNNGHEYP